MTHDQRVRLVRLAPVDLDHRHPFCAYGERGLIAQPFQPPGASAGLVATLP